MDSPDYRTGIGFDSHALAPGRRLVLGGVTVPHDRGLVGHSDGDVLVHAIMDALLGAANLGDKGQHFPSDDARYKDISSLALLAQVGDLLVANGWRISNVDATMLAQKPRLGALHPGYERSDRRRPVSAGRAVKHQGYYYRFYGICRAGRGYRRRCGGDNSSTVMKL